MKIILDKSEIEVLEKVAEEHSLPGEGIMAFLCTRCEANFEQDLQDIAGEFESEIRRDF